VTFRPRILGAIAAMLIVVWLVLLAVLGALQGQRIAGQITERVGESLVGSARIDDADLSLLRGDLRLDRLTVHRDDLTGHLAVECRELHAELAPLGWALVDPDVRTLALRGVRLAVSSAAMFHLRRPKREPIRAAHVVIDDAELRFDPGAFAAGIGAITIRVEHASSGETVLRTPLSWLLDLDELRAELDLPAGLHVRLVYARGSLTASGSVFGTAVTIPLTLPGQQATSDNQHEVAQLVALGKDVAERLVARRADDYVDRLLGRR
jgi:hypothetical protein